MINIGSNNKKIYLGDKELKNGYLGEILVYSAIEPFVSLWKTTTPNESITLPYDDEGTYSGTIDWGDGTVVENTYANRTHVYTDIGDYTITIKGDIVRFKFNNGNSPNGNGVDREKIYNISKGLNNIIFEDDIFGSSGDGGFYGCVNLDINEPSKPFVLPSSARDFFRNCPIPSLKSIDYSQVRVFRRGFNNSDFNPNEITINSEDIIELDNTFRGCSFDCPISIIGINIDTLNAALGNNPNFNNTVYIDVGDDCDFRELFVSCTSFNSSLTLSSTTRPKSTRQMFQSASSFNQPLIWDNSQNTNMFRVFFAANSFNQDISNLDYSNVVNVSGFMQGKASSNYDYQNYDSLLIKWDSGAANGGLDFTKLTNFTTNFGTIQYSSVGATARASLVSQGLIITDGGNNGL